jgi:hypothetical protein
MRTSWVLSRSAESCEAVSLTTRFATTARFSRYSTSHQLEPSDPTLPFPESYDARRSRSLPSTSAVTDESNQYESFATKRISRNNHQLRYQSTPSSR